MPIKYRLNLPIAICRWRRGWWIGGKKSKRPHKEANLASPTRRGL
jgi:hypothetical protein